MRKKLLCLLLVLIMPVMVLAGCGKIPVSDDFTIEETSRFVFVKEYIINKENHSYFRILVDKETKVMYLYKVDAENAHSGNAGLTVMLNADGTPMLWEGEL